MVRSTRSSLFLPMMAVLLCMLHECVVKKTYAGDADGDAGITIYVDDDAEAGGDGLSWESSFRYLQDALSLAGEPENGITEIRVAGGAYRPDRDEGTPAGTGDRNASFFLISGVAIQGGYLGLDAGVGENPDDRAVEKYESILTGDLNEDDELDGGGTLENAYQVVTALNADNTAVLDGFTIAAGRADGPHFGASPDSRDQGSGLNVYFAQPQILNCTFIDNWAINHGTLNDHGGVTLIGCTFEDNYAESHGAGFYVHVDVAAVVQGCTFINNHTPGKGGGAYDDGGIDMVFTDCVFIGNSADRGGGFYADTESAPTVIDCTFLMNEATTRAGGAYVDQGAVASFQSCEFEQHQATQGGTFYVDQATLIVESTNVSDSTALFGSGAANFGYGGVAYVDDSTVTFEDCTFSVLSAERYGGGAYVDGLSVATFEHCTIEHASAELGGAGIYGALDPLIMINHSVFDSNSLVTTSFGGSALFGVAANFDVRNTRFVNNTSSHLGGVIHALADANHISCTNCVFWNNDSGDVVIKGLPITTNDITLTNCTISRPSADIGIWNEDGILTIENSIIWNTSLTDLGLTTAQYTTSNMFTLPGPGVSTEDPMFADPAGGDLMLLPGSPSIDAGNNSLVPKGVTTDAGGFARFVDDPDTVDTGAGRSPIVDLGAYEFQVITATCSENLDGRGDVGFGDLLILLAAWGECPRGSCPADLDQSGDVGFSDLLVLLAAWGPCS